MERIISKGRHVLGKLSRNCDKQKPRTCEAALTWDLRERDGRMEFSAQGEVWNHIKTDLIRGGQCVDDLAALFPHDKRAQRIYATWKDWHLNGMNAGTPEQERALERAERDALELLRTTNAPASCFYDAEKTKPNWYVAGDYITGETGAGYYGWACAVLKQAGLYEVPVTPELRESALGGLPADATTYRYGSRWLYRAIPDDVIALIRAGFIVSEPEPEPEPDDEPGQEDDDPITRAGLSVIATFVPFSQSRNRGEKQRSLNWRVTLRKDGRDVLTTDYSQGVGHCPSYKRANICAGDKRLLVAHECETGTHGRMVMNAGSIMRGKPIELDGRQVIHSLLLEASVLDAGTFRDWCAEYGYDADSIEDRATHDQCVEHALALRGAVGPAMFDELRQAAG